MFRMHNGKFLTLEKSQAAVLREIRCAATLRNIDVDNVTMDRVGGGDCISLGQ